MLKLGPVILLFVAAEAIHMNPAGLSPEAKLIKHFEKATAEKKGDFMKQEGFRVRGRIHGLKLENVTFVNPHLRWDPFTAYNITEVEVDRAMLWGPRINRCGSCPTLRVSETDTRRRSIFDSKPNDSHGCTIRLCVSGITGLDLPIGQGLTVEGNDEWTMLKDVSSRSWDEAGGGGLSRFGGGTTPKRGEVEISYTITRYHIYNGWTLRDLAAVAVLLVAVVHRITGKKTLSLLVGLVFILVVNYLAAGHFFSRRAIFTHLTWSLLYIVLLFLATVAIAVTVAQERKQNNLTEEAKRLAVIRNAVEIMLMEQ